MPHCTSRTYRQSPLPFRAAEAAFEHCPDAANKREQLCVVDGLSAGESEKGGGGTLVFLDRVSADRSGVFFS